MAISAHETGFWTSRRFRRDHNWFGFRRGTYCKYSAAEESIADYQQFESRVIAEHGLNTEEKYRRHLAATYAKDRRWMSKVTKALKKLK